MSKKQYIKFIRLLLLRETILRYGIILCAVQALSQETNSSASLFRYTFNVGSLESGTPEDAILYYRGNILDVNGWPIMGVEIEDQSTCKIIISDANGEFSIAAHPKNILLFKSESFYTKEVVLGEHEKLTITLEEIPYYYESVVDSTGMPWIIGRELLTQEIETILHNDLSNGNERTFFGHIFHSIGNLIRKDE